MKWVEVLVIDGPFAGHTVMCGAKQLFFYLPATPPGPGEIAVAIRPRLGVHYDEDQYTVCPFTVIDRKFHVALKGCPAEIPYEKIADLVLSEVARKVWQ